MSDSINHTLVLELVGEKNIIRVTGDIPEAHYDLDNTEEDNVGALKQIGRDWFAQHGDKCVQLLQQKN